MQVDYQTPNGYFPYASPKDEDCLPILLVSCPITHEIPLDISITLFILLFHINFFSVKSSPAVTIRLKYVHACKGLAILGAYCIFAWLGIPVDARIITPPNGYREVILKPGKFISLIG